MDVHGQCHNLGYWKRGSKQLTDNQGSFAEVYFPSGIGVGQNNRFTFEFSDNGWFYDFLSDFLSVDTHFFTDNIFG
jgi:hypothetical protein